MGFLTSSGLSGVGHMDIGGLVSVNEVAARLETPSTFGTITGTSPVRRVHKHGFFCIGFTPTGGPLTGIFVVTRGWYLQYEAMDIRLADGDHQFADTLYYDIAAGAVMYLEVDWD